MRVVTKLQHFTRSHLKTVGHFLKKDVTFICVHMSESVHACVHVHTSGDAEGSQKSASDPLELRFTEVVSHSSLLSSLCRESALLHTSLCFLSEGSLLSLAHRSVSVISQLPMAQSPDAEMPLRSLPQGAKRAVPGRAGHRLAKVSQDSVPTSPARRHHFCLF